MSETRTPAPVFDEETGYLCLSNGAVRQVVLRFKWPFFYVLWKKGEKQEVPIRIDELFRLILGK
jgi:hypothetical protein